MSDALFVTSGDARRQVENGWHDAIIMRMWWASCDTLDIARALTVHESVAARRLWQVRVASPCVESGGGEESG